MTVALVICLFIALPACAPAEAPSDSGDVDELNMVTTDEPQEPGQLGPEDWEVAGVFPGADSALVRRQLGSPQEIRTSQHPYDAFGELVFWEYSGLTVHFNQPSTASGATIRGREFATHRGIAVGDPLERVEEEYGPPDDTEWDRWLYCHPEYEECVTLILFRNQDGRVTEVFLGVPPD